MGMNRFFNTDSSNDTGSSGTDTGSSDNEVTQITIVIHQIVIVIIIDDNKSEMSYNSDEF